MNALTAIHYVLIDYENIQPKNLLLLAQDSFHVVFFVGPNQEKIRVELLDLMQRLGNDRVKHIKVEEKGKNSLDFHLAYYLGRLVERNSEGHYYVISKDSGYDPLISHLGSRQIKAYRHEDISRIPSLKHTSASLLSNETPQIQTRSVSVDPSATSTPKDLIIQLSGSRKAGKSPLLPLASANFLNTPKKTAASVTAVKVQGSVTTKQSVSPKLVTTKTQEPPSKIALAKANLAASKANRPLTVKTLTNHLRAMFKKENLSDSDLATLIAKLQNKGHLKVEGTKVSYPKK